ncbi:hypothetical protein C8Q74DRAFT_1046458 [Fomes fomentarius]|nr:hypothetical protein C8Q74DRAFT_1046458 [Fomes fomentarius]
MGRAEVRRGRECRAYVVAALCPYLPLPLSLLSVTWAVVGLLCFPFTWVFVNQAHLRPCIRRVPSAQFSRSVLYPLTCSLSTVPTAWPRKSLHPVVLLHASSCLHLAPHIHTYTHPTHLRISFPHIAHRQHCLLSPRFPCLWHRTRRCPALPSGFWIIVFTGPSLVHVLTTSSQLPLPKLHNAHTLSFPHTLSTTPDGRLSCPVHACNRRCCNQGCTTMYPTPPRSLP